MNTYEELLLNNKRKLEGIITDLLQDQIDNNDIEPEELKEIRKVIDFSFHIEATCTFETETPVVNGYMNFSSMDDFLNKEEYYDLTSDVEWENDFDCGQFTWNNTPSICIDGICLSQDASEEAKSLLKSLENTSTTLDLQRQMVLLQQRIERARLAE